MWGDPAWSDELDREAAQLKRRFNEDFWLPERNCFALALDGHKRKVDSLTSNIGHLLWSGIADEEKAKHCAAHLMGDALFSGWGVRTMALGEGAYNPIGYHVGTVWPHDNAFIAWGLRRYGFDAEAARVVYAMMEAAEFFNHRLPEAFAGAERGVTRFPVEYPTACSPQAWASGAPLLFIRTLLGLEFERREPDHRSGAATHDRAAGGARHSGCVGTAGRLRTLAHSPDRRGFPRLLKSSAPTNAWAATDVGIGSELPVGVMPRSGRRGVSPGWKAAAVVIGLRQHIAP